MKARQTQIETAVEALRAGEVIAFPTETVYGLGANASNPVAVRKIFALKGRPAEHPVIVHLDHPRYLHRWVRSMTAEADKLAAAFWPGPLTLILPRADNVSDLVTGGQDSVGIRIPAHVMAQQLLTAFGGGIAAPSANRYGRLSPTRPEHVRDEFGDALSIILDGGDSQIGLESTIVSCVGARPRLLRPGSITKAQLVAVVGELSELDPAPRAPGDRARHYAPGVPVEIVHADEIELRAAEITGKGQKVGVLAMRRPLQTQRYMTWINAGHKPDVYARSLYNHLRTLDKTGCVKILVQDTPTDESWTAIRDRLMRASGVDTASADDTLDEGGMLSAAS